MISVNLSQFLVVYLTTVALIQAYWLTGHKKQYHYLTTVLFICYTCNMATFQSQHNGCLWSIKKLILCMILTLEEKEVEPLKLGWRSLDHAKMKITCTGCYSALRAFMSLTFTLRDWEKKEEKRLSADSLNHCKIVEALHQNVLGLYDWPHWIFTTHICFVDFASITALCHSLEQKAVQVWDLSFRYCQVFWNCASSYLSVMMSLALQCVLLADLRSQLPLVLDGRHACRTYKLKQFDMMLTSVKIYKGIAIVWTGDFLKLKK